jgi:alpha-D-xyloside xylohydrolase
MRVIDHWSDLLPAPEESLELAFYPDGVKEIRISAYDQFFPARQDAFALAFVEKNGLCQRTTLSFEAQHDEKFVGTGERFTKMDLSGHTFQLKNQDGQGVNNRRTYKNIPFYLSSRMYGLFMHTSAHSKISLADHTTRSVQLLTEEPALDLFLIGGLTPEEILYEYRRLTGFPTVLPLWSFGTWMSRMSYFSADEVNAICKRLRDEDYPCDVIHIDTGWFITDWLCEWKFNPERFPEPKQFIKDLRENGFKVSLWQMPYIAAQAAQHDEAMAEKFMCRLKKSEQQGGSNFSALDYAGTIDFTYPKAVEWYKNLLRNLLEMGVVCIKTDFGEEIHMDAEYHSMKPEFLNNLYALLYQKAAFEVTKEVTGEGIVWARAGWAGCQRYPLH